MIERLKTYFGTDAVAIESEASSQLDTVDQSRRTALKVLASFGLLVVPSIEGCGSIADEIESDGLLYTNNYDLSKIKPLSVKGQRVEVQTLTEKDYYGIISREWEKNNLHLDPSKLIKLPQEPDRSFGWLGDNNYIRQVIEAAGYTVIDMSPTNGITGVNFYENDNIRNGFSLSFLSHETGNAELVLRAAGAPNEFGQFNPTELRITMVPPDQNYVPIYANNGHTEENLFATSSTTMTVKNITADSMQLLIGGKELEIRTKEEFWNYISNSKESSIILFLINNAPISFLKPIDEADLVEMIRCLPSNDPTFFEKLVDRLVVGKMGDINLSYEYKAPMTTLADGWGDCDDYTMLNGFWGKLNGFLVQFHIWNYSKNGDGNHVNSVLTNPQTREIFMCDNNFVIKGATDVNQRLSAYQSNYKSPEVVEI